MLQKVVVWSIVHVLNLRTIMHKIVISFSINCITTKIEFYIHYSARLNDFRKFELYTSFAEKL